MTFESSPGDAALRARRVKGGSSLEAKTRLFGTSSLLACGGGEVGGLFLLKRTKARVFFFFAVGKLRRVSRKGSDDSH